MASSSPNTRKSARLVKQAPLITPVKRNHQKDEKINTQTSLRRSARGKKDASLSIKSKLFDDGSNLFEVNRKNPREKSLSEINVDEKKVGIFKKTDQEFSGIKRKNMNGRSFRALFRAQKRQKIALASEDDSERKDAPSDADDDVTSKDDSKRKDAPSDADDDFSKLSDSNVMEPRDQEGNESLGELDNDTEEECFKRFDENRKRVPNFDGPSKEQEMENDSGKKHREVIDNGVNSSPENEPAHGQEIRNGNQSLLVPAMGGTLSSPSPASSLNSHEKVYLPEDNQDQSAERLISYDRKSVHVCLTAEMEKLCELLALEVDVKRVLHLFLGYVVENYGVSMENVAIFQALQISLCWIAASMLDQKIDRQDSLMLVKQKLNFECSDQAAEIIYKKLRKLKKTFLKQPNIIEKLKPLINPTSTKEHALKDILDAKTLEPIHICNENEEIVHEQNLTDVAHAQWDQSCNNELEKRSMLCEKQQEETNEFHERWEEKRLQLEKRKLVEAAIIRQILSRNVADRTEKLKMLDIEYSRNLEEHKKLMEAGLLDLKTKHLAAKIEEREKESQWRLAKHRGTENRISDEVSACSFAPTRLATHEGERSPILRDEDPNEVACPSYPPERHPESDQEAHGKQPSASNVHYHHHVLKGIDSQKTVTSNEDSHNKTFAGEANDSHPADVPDDVLEEVRRIGDPVTNTIVMQSIRAKDGVDRLFGSDTPDLLVIQRDDTNGTDSSPDQGSLVAHSHEERLPVLRDEEPNEVACPSYSPERHPKSNREIHEKQPSASNLLYHHHHVFKGVDSQKTVMSNGESHEKTFPVEANESHPEDVPEEVRSFDDPDTIDTVMQSTRAEDGEGRVFGSDAPDLLVNQRDDAHGTDPSPDLGTSVTQSHEATMDDLPHCAVTIEVQCEDQPNEENLSQLGESVEPENVVHLVSTRDLAAEADCASSGAAENGHTSEFNNSTCFEKQLPSMEQLPLGPDSGSSACQSLNNGCNTFQATETIRQVEEPPNHSQHQPQVTENSGMSSSSEIRNPNICNNWHNQPPVDNQSGQPTSGSSASRHRVAQPVVIDDGLYQRINGAVLQAANQSVLSNSRTRLQTDPLVNEVEKLRKEIEQAKKGHENLKSQLRSDCEKEIMEVVSEIRNKYKAKFQDADTLFQLKTKTLESNVNWALFNKILADLVSAECIDVIPSGVLIQQGFMHQLHQIPLQPTPGPSNVCSVSAGSTPAAHQNIPLQPTRGPTNVVLPSAGSTPTAKQNIPLQPTGGPSNVGLSLTGSTPAAQQNIPVQRTREPSNVGSSLPGEPRLASVSVSAPIINSISCPQTNARVGANFRAAAPHLQPVGSNVRAAAPHLQPVGSNVRAAAPHLQPVGAGIRAAAPHFQHFRPPVPVPDTSNSSLPRPVTTQQLSVNQCSVTLPPHQLPVQPRELLRQQPSPIQPLEPSPRISYAPSQVCPPGFRTSSLHITPPPSQRSDPAYSPFTHPSALELLRDFDRRYNVVEPNPSVAPAVVDSNVAPLSQSSPSTVVSTNVVYLSDDE